MEKKKIKLWKKILIIIGIIILIFLVRTTRNMIILKKIDKAISTYQNANNVHITCYTYYGDSLNITESYKKDDKYIVNVNADNRDHNRRLINYCNGETVNTYIESDIDKIAILNSNGLPTAEAITNYVETDNIWQFIIMSCCASIKSEVCNGKECYKLSNLLSSSVILGSDDDLSKIDFSIYIEKETGLMIREFNGTSGEGNDKINTVIDMKYEFDTVKDSDIVEPDISEYTVQEDN